MNWGVKISLVLAVFMIAIVSAGIYMVSRDTDTLEDYDYYEQGLQYDAVMEQKQNLLKHGAVPTLSVAADSLFIEFVKPGNAGQLLLRRPSDRSEDTVVAFDVSGTVYQLPVAELSRGLWEVKLEWASNGTLYLHEQRIFIN